MVKIAICRGAQVREDWTWLESLRVGQNRNNILNKGLFVICFVRLFFCANFYEDIVSVSQTKTALKEHE